MNEFKLIKGEFEASDAREILFNLLDDKITFHYRKMFSHQERFGTKDHHSVERVKTLKATKMVINDLLDKADKEGRMVTLNSSISLL